MLVNVNVMKDTAILVIKSHYGSKIALEEIYMHTCIHTCIFDSIMFIMPYTLNMKDAKPIQLFMTFINIYVHIS